MSSSGVKVPDLSIGFIGVSINLYLSFTAESLLFLVKVFNLGISFISIRTNFNFGGFTKLILNMLISIIGCLFNLLTAFFKGGFHLFTGILANATQNLIHLFDIGHQVFNRNIKADRYCTVIGHQLPPFNPNMEAKLEALFFI